MAFFVSEEDLCFQAFCGAQAWQPLREQRWAKPETLLGSTEITNYFIAH